MLLAAVVRLSRQTVPAGRSIRQAPTLHTFTIRFIASTTPFSQRVQKRMASIAVSLALLALFAPLDIFRIIDPRL